MQYRFVVIPYYLSLRYNIKVTAPTTAGVVIPYYLSLRYNCGRCETSRAGSCNSLLSLAKV